MGAELARRAFKRAVQADDHPPETDPDQPTRKPADHDLTYHRHVSGVRQVMDLENRVANNSFAPKGAPAPDTSAAPHWSETLDLGPDEDEDEEEKGDFRDWLKRGILLEAAWLLTPPNPDREETQQTIREAIDEILTLHPEDHVSTQFERICEALAIPPDRTRLPPDVESQIRPPTPRHPNPH